MGGELEDVGLLSGARGGKEIFDHDESPLVVEDHELQEEPFELGPMGRGKAIQLLVREHTGHVRVIMVRMIVVMGVMVRMMAMVMITVTAVFLSQRVVEANLWDLLSPFVEPPGHDPDLVVLGAIDALSQEAQITALRPVIHHPRQDQGLGVVMDHVLHEADVRRMVGGTGGRELSRGGAGEKDRQQEERHQNQGGSGRKTGGRGHDTTG